MNQKHFPEKFRELTETTEKIYKDYCKVYQ